MKLLIFTEHKDTLDYLAGDGKEHRPLGKLREWGLSLTQIHGGMKIGDRDTPGGRIFAEREFKESAQVLVATEAAGEGINLQFCWLMINYDIPWNPVRLEQRMGRIHRYGQEKDCLIFNFVSTNTREGRVLHKLFERIEAIQDDLDPKRTGKIFNVLGDVFPANQLEKMLREDTSHFRAITESTLEGLAKRELNLSAIIGKSAEARERRLVPEVIEDFFLLGLDYFLYVVFHCGTPEPSLNILRDPAKLDWQPFVKVEHYRLRIESPATPVLREDPPEYRAGPQS